MNQLNVTTSAQRTLFLLEIQGQLSDGMWENTTPLDHWEQWCSLKAEDVQIDVANAGRNFWVKKDNYRLWDKELLEVVGTRMILYVRLSRILPLEDVEDCVSAFCNENDLDHPWMVETMTPSAYRQGRIEKMIAKGIDPSIIKEFAEDTTYGIVELKQDLHRLQAAMKTWLA